MIGLTKKSERLIVVGLQSDQSVVALWYGGREGEKVPRSWQVGGAVGEFPLGALPWLPGRLTAGAPLV